MRDFLVEIHTEELPPKSLQRLASQFLQEITSRLTKSELTFNNTRFFATPRRLAVLVQQLSTQQPDSIVERKGPALSAAFDQQGNPTPACLGFLRSCGITPEQLEKTITPQGEWVSYKQSVTGKNTETLLPTIIQQAVAALAIPKRMRWGNEKVEFARPVHSVILLFGDEVISSDILGVETGRKTRGHRFHSPDWIDIPNPSAYEKILEKHFVLVDFEKRKETIRSLTIDEVKTINSVDQLADKPKQSIHAVIDEALLEEITGIVEWPVPLCGHFDSEFLTVPEEALISAMQDHQRYFPIQNDKNTLQPYFITISNIESKNPKQVIAGNERVLRARLADAKFFFDTDMKYFKEISHFSFSNKTAPDWFVPLKNIIYINKLGTLSDKAFRLQKLSAIIAEKIGGDSKTAANAGLLAKVDLTSQLVGEFPELQGIAGSYYFRPKHFDNTNEISLAIREHYLPRFSGDKLPTTPISCSVALADRLDLLVGLFGINQIPTGEKDPFGLRRAALGILRIIIENKYNLDIFELIKENLVIYQEARIEIEKNAIKDKTLSFIFDRLKPWYQEQGISADVYASVAALNITRPYDFHCRILAVQAFTQLPEAEALSSANKRVSNILSKYNGSIDNDTLNPQLFEENAEYHLAELLTAERNAIADLSNAEKYTDILTRLATLREPVDHFFDKVLVMTEDKPRRENRLLLLKQLRELFLHVADIALLQ